MEHKPRDRQATQRRVPRSKRSITTEAQRLVAEASAKRRIAQKNNLSGLRMCATATSLVHPPNVYKCSLNKDHSKLAFVSTQQSSHLLCSMMLTHLLGSRLVGLFGDEARDHLPSGWPKYETKWASPCFLVSSSKTG
jgi:hypothetical protein